ncbi:Uncharacterised protein [Mycobacteroides abscessus subsp. abscessus]|nr:Uncharacterised protein [Mycobacteroides abscessus subsp. abscessus]
MICCSRDISATGLNSPNPSASPIASICDANCLGLLLCARPPISSWPTSSSTLAQGLPMNCSVTEYGCITYWGGTPAGRGWPSGLTLPLNANRGGAAGSFFTAPLLGGTVPQPISRPRRSRVKNPSRLPAMMSTSLVARVPVSPRRSLIPTPPLTAIPSGSICATTTLLISIRARLTGVPNTSAIAATLFSSIACVRGAPDAPSSRSAPVPGSSVKTTPPCSRAP